MKVIYHITSLDRWEAAQQQGFYTDPSLEAEGFIHCSEASQVAGVLQRYFAGQTGLIKLTIDTSKLTAPLRYDLAPSIGEAFPHIYGPINLDAVVKYDLLTG